MRLACAALFTLLAGAPACLGTDDALLLPVGSTHGGFGSNTTSSSTGSTGGGSGGGSGGGHPGFGDGLYKLVASAGSSSSEGGIGAGLCAPCNDSSQCGGPDDHCIENTRTDDQFCGRSCGRDAPPCPDGYDCTSFSGAADQCVPTSGTCSGSHTTGGNDAGSAFADLISWRAEALSRINSFRANQFLPPLVEDACLDSTAQTGAEQMAAGARPYASFEQVCGGSGFCSCGWKDEAQGSTNAAAGSNFQDAIDSVLRAIDAQGRMTREYLALYGPYVHAGVGIVWQNDELDLTIDFAP